MQELYNKIHISKILFEKVQPLFEKVSPKVSQKCRKSVSTTCAQIDARFHHDLGASRLNSEKRGAHWAESLRSPFGESASGNH